MRNVHATGWGRVSAPSADAPVYPRPSLSHHLRLWDFGVVGEKR